MCFYYLMRFSLEPVSEMSSDKIKLLAYLILDTRNSMGLTIDELGRAKFNQSSVSHDKYIIHFKENLFQENFWLLKLFLQDGVFTNMLSRKIEQLKNPSFRANILGKQRKITMDFLDEHHPYGSIVLPLITGFINQK